MKRNHVTPNDILFISVSLFIIVVLWVFSNIYHAYVTTTISPDLQLQITPIDPNFDTATLSKLKSRQVIVPLFDALNPAATPAGTLTPAPTATITPPVTSPGLSPVPTAPTITNQPTPTP
ncbi:MAG TPA: hypothetical protein VF810_00845 [Patescibacteria group bacterium]